VWVYAPSIFGAALYFQNRCGIGLNEGFALAQIIKIREDELEFLNAIKDLNGARQSLWHDDIKLMVITTGLVGCMFFSPTLKVEAIF
jgi:sugar/nucleoside kinase (ribokinase family)